MPDRRFLFGDFELDEPRFELRREGSPVPLQPKALDLLLHLVRHRARVVSREELFAELWSDVVVSSDSLSKAVSLARHALGDAGEAQRFIQTVRGRGFRFVAPVEEHASEENVAPAGSEADGAFVGREDVLGRIGAALSVADGGSGRVVLITGEAGMGKNS